MNIFYNKIFKSSILGLLVTCSFALSFYFSFYSWDKQVSISVISKKKQSRGLATNQGNRNIATFSLSSVFDSQNIFKKAQEITPSSSQVIQFVLGNIVLQDSLGNKDFVCQFFKSITLFFEALDIFIEGERVIMKLTTPCLHFSDNNYIGPFSIPHKSILKSQITQTKFKEGIHVIEFINTAISWPSQWLLKSVFLKNSSSEYQIDYKTSLNLDDSFSITFK